MAYKVTLLLHSELAKIVTYLTEKRIKIQMHLNIFQVLRMKFDVMIIMLTYGKHYFVELYMNGSAYYYKVTVGFLKL